MFLVLVLLLLVKISAYKSVPTNDSLNYNMFYDLTKVRTLDQPVCWSQIVSVGGAANFCLQKFLTGLAGLVYYLFTFDQVGNVLNTTNQKFLLRV